MYMLTTVFICSSLVCFAAEFGKYQIPSSYHPLPNRVAGQKCLQSDNPRYHAVKNGKLHAVSEWELGKVCHPASTGSGFILTIPMSSMYKCGAVCIFDQHEILVGPLNLFT